MSIWKRILGVVTGLFVGAIFVEVGDNVSMMMVHPPEGFNPNDPKSLAELTANLPITLFLIMLAGYVVGAFLGGLVATLITGREASRPAMIVGILLTIGGTINLMAIPHPMWFNIVSTLIYIPLAWCGWRVIRRVPSA